ncbi:MAG: error-prone DNA polymerase [Devosia sp.]
MSENVVSLLERLKPPASPAGMPAYAELVTTSNFSFLRGGSSPEELVIAATALGLKGLGLCDRNSFAGVVRAHTVMRDLKNTFPDFRYLVGTRLVFHDGTPDIVAYPTDLAAYGRLCRLLTAGNLRAGKGSCELYIEDLKAHAEGLLFILQADENAWGPSAETLRHLRQLAPERVWLAAACRFHGNDRARLHRLADLARNNGVPLIASNDVLYHEPQRRMMQDVVTCIREHLTIFEAGRRLEANAERHLKAPEEMLRLFREFPDAIAETQRFIARIDFSLDELEYNYPEETIGDGETAQETLIRLTWEGAIKRYPEGIPYKVKRGVLRELKLIAKMKYAAYFLTVHDIVRYARHDRGILCQGRGSAANSMVCYCLEVTEVEPVTGNLVFGRFLSTERNEPPDIDVDFEHERREEVMQYIYKKYGRFHAGLTATVVTYRSKGAMRDVAKVFGLSTDVIDALNSMSWSSYLREADDQKIKEIGFDPSDPTIARVLAISGELMGFPRHLSQHVGGFILTRDRLDDLVPISNAAMEDRTVVEWDKADIESLKLLKVDVLALGMLSCVRRAFDLMHMHYGLDLSRDGLMRAQDDRVYKMTHRADTIGVFQIESRAQMSMLPRLKPKEFYDLVIEVAIVRPGPIQGGMVHPYLQRRMKKEQVTYPSPQLAAVLERTCGVPLFQEQAMQIAVVGAGFSPGEADQLRRSMATFKRTGGVGVFRDKFINGMLNNKYDKTFAEACFRQIEGFGSYGFPESHAASFALLVYVSCWLKCHYPDVFACALLNSQPMGFYAPAQIVRDAEEHGVEIRRADVNSSDYWNILEDGWRAAEHVWDRHAEMRGDIRSTKALRLGFHEIKSFKEEHAMRLMARRGSGYGSIRDLWLRTGLPISAIEALGEADAFGSLGLSRRQALWAVKGLVGNDGAETLPLFINSAPTPAHEREDDLPLLSRSEDVIHDYRTMSFSLKAHPLSFLRPTLRRLGILSAAELGNARDGQRVEVAGLVLVRQRPGTASGIVFSTLEDETGIANVVIWNKIFETHRRVILSSRLLSVRGRLQVEGLVIHVISESFTDYTDDLVALANGHSIGDASLARADEGKSGTPDPRMVAQVKLEELAERAARAALPRGRNFH